MDEALWFGALSPEPKKKELYQAPEAHHSVEQGRMTIKEAQVAYNLKTEKTVRDWLLRHKGEKVDICIETLPEMAKQKVSMQPPGTEALEKALQEAELKIKALNTMIDVAEEQLKIDIRKKSGAKQS